MSQVWQAEITAIHPIPNKDRIVLATVNGYQSIVPKDKYHVGDTVLYISEQSILPETLFDHFGLRERAKGAQTYKVKPMKMGGVLSQGLIAPLSELKVHAADLVFDWDEYLGIEKWEPTIPTHLSGKVGRPQGNAPIAPMYDIENIKKMRHLRNDFDNRGNITREYWYDPFEGEHVIITEKLHGTNFAFHLNADNGDDPDSPLDTFYVYSKGLGKQGHVLLEDETNAYWKAFRMYPQLAEFARVFLIETSSRAITLRGEIIGSGIQDLDYGMDFDLALFAFECHLSDGSVVSRHPWQPNGSIVKHLDGVPVIPILFEGRYNHDFATQLSEGNNLYGTPGKHVREGVVVAHSSQYRQMNGSRFAAKFINPDYLVRKNGTEFN